MDDNHPPIILAPIPAATRIDVAPMARVMLGFAGVRDALAQPAYSHEFDFPGDPEASRCIWRVRDTNTGAMLVAWDQDSPAQTPAETTEWLVWWADGEGHPRSGQWMLDVLLGDTAGGQVVML